MASIVGGGGDFVVEEVALFMEDVETSPEAGEWPSVSKEPVTCGRLSRSPSIVELAEEEEVTGTAVCYIRHALLSAHYDLV